MTKRDPLLGKIDKFLADLMVKAASDTVGGEGEPPIDFRDRVTLLSAATRWMAVKHKVEPDGEGDDFLGAARRKLAAPEAKAGNHQRRADPRNPGERGNGSGGGVDHISLNPPAPAGRAVAFPDPDGNNGPGESIGQTGSDFWRAAGNGAGTGGAADAPAGAGRGNGAGGHGDE